MANFAQADRRGVVAQAVAVLRTSVLALEHLGIQTDILVTVVTALVAIAGFTLAITFALGARPLVTHILTGHALRQVLPEGRSGEVSGRTGVVERVGAVDTPFRDGDRQWSMANGTLLEEVIER